jgi:DNA primase
MMWDEGQPWRTVSGKLLRKINAGTMYDVQLKRIFVYLPCKVNNTVVGFIRANVVKQGKANYFNSDGAWTFKRGLFPYDFVKGMIRKRKYRTVVLVEGPRDALKCIQYGIPAIACLGASNWSDMKTELILALTELNVDTVITAFDPDEAGVKLTSTVYAALKDEIKVRQFKFPEDVDPGSMPKDIAVRLKSYCVPTKVAA